MGKIFLVPCVKCAQLNSLMTEILLVILSVGMCEYEGNKPINQLVEDTVVSTQCIADVSMRMGLWPGGILISASMRVPVIVS